MALEEFYEPVMSDEQKNIEANKLLPKVLSFMQDGFSYNLENLIADSPHFTEQEKKIAHDVYYQLISLLINNNYAIPDIESSLRLVKIEKS